MQTLHETPELAPSADFLQSLSKDELISKFGDFEARLQTSEQENEAYIVERQQFQKVIAEINNDSSLQTRRLLDASSTTNTQPLDRENPAVTQLDNNVLREYTTINNCSFSVKIHERPSSFLSSLLKNYISKVEKRDGDEITRIGVTSVKDEELGSALPNPHPTWTKKLRLVLNTGTILLQPLPFEQTSFTFTAQGLVIYEFVRQLDIGSPMSPSRGVGVIAAMKAGLQRTPIMANPAMLGRTFSNRTRAKTKCDISAGTRKVALGVKADDLFCKIGGLFYARFEKEAVIDARMTEDFINNIPHAPPLMVDEQNLIARSIKLVEEISSNARAKRIAGTANETVEKFLHKPEGGGAVVGMTVAKMDVSATRLFAYLWLLDTYANKAKNKDRKIRVVWTNLDGKRSQQYTRSLSLPGFQDRIFEIWQTWERTEDGEGRPTFIFAISTIDEYKGTHHRDSGTENMTKATTKGVYVIKGLSENTCSWTRAQSFDLNISIPANMLDFLAKGELSYANAVQEKFMRNGKVVDMERANFLVEVMIKRRGTPLMDDQLPVFRSVSYSRMRDRRGHGGTRGLRVPQDEQRGDEELLRERWG
ncbi:hypothetical protein TrLO_g5584 [Triparma laevis f. longispina]|uniref:Uncharacterized protein n=1 Tax=Triparma laevis f. longispina TaxID=1714387 RepID=A0A9W7ACP5_9STRA|nr:hypothetical protein TrLO_g5584 [Triparma laevis f. longispina]